MPASRRSRTAVSEAAGTVATARRPRLGVGAKSMVGYLVLRVTLVVVLVGVVLWGFTTLVGGGGGSGAALAPPSPVGATGFALRFVPVYLAAGNGTEGSLTPYLAAPVVLNNVQPGSFRVAAADAVDATLVGPGYWRVTVAAQVYGAPPRAGGDVSALGSASTTIPASSYVPLGERCYLVAVEARRGGFVSPVVPSQVACPGRAPAAATVFGSPGPANADDPVTVAVTQFVTVMLAGPADTMGRYLAPGAAVAAITPAPYTSVSVTGISKSETTTVGGVAQVLVFVGVEATDSAGRVSELEYTVQLVRPLNQWLVAKLYGAPPLAH